MPPHPHRQGLLGKPQFIGLLKIHPEFSRRIEGRQPHHRISRDGTFTFDDGRDPIRWHLERFGQGIGVK